jgi:hypothetical protein
MSLLIIYYLQNLDILLPVLIIILYCATLIKELKKEVLVTLINIYYSKLCVRHIQRTYSLPARVFIQKQYKVIRERLRQRRRKRAQLA